MKDWEAAGYAIVFFLLFMLIIPLLNCIIYSPNTFVVLSMMGIICGIGVGIFVWFVIFSKRMGYL